MSTDPARPLALALLGLGTHGHRYLKHIVEDVSEVTLLAACRRHPTAQDRELAGDIPIVTRADEILTRSDIEAVVIATPAETHHALTRAALEAGKHVLLEKPMTLDPDDGLDLVRLARERDLTLMVAQTLRYDAGLKALAAHIAPAAAINGNLVHYSSRGRRIASDEGPAPGMPVIGTLLETGVHFLDFIRTILGPGPLTVRAQVDDLEGPELEAWIFLEGPRGRFLIELSRSAPSIFERLDVKLDDRTIHFHRLEHRLEERVDRDRTPLELPERSPSLPRVVADFARAVRSGDDPPITGLDGLIAVHLATACRESARSQRPVRVDPEAIGALAGTRSGD